MTCDKPSFVKPVLSLLLLAGVATGCSVKRFAVNQVGNALAGRGTTFSSDDDPELIRQAVPFGLKLQENLLAESPRHRKLLLSLASGFTQYGFAFVHQDANELEETNLAAAQAARDRARRLYLRARNYGLRGLEVAHPGFSTRLQADPTAAVRQATKADVPFLFWTAAPWGAAISISKDQPDKVAELPQVVALIERAMELDEKFERGAIHSFYINLEMGRPGAKLPAAAAQARKHFERAVELSEGKLAGPYVTLAEAVCVAEQNRAEFVALLNKALAVDVEAAPDDRLINLVAQRRARWLLARVDDLFVE